MAVGALATPYALGVSTSIAAHVSRHGQGAACVREEVARGRLPVDGDEAYAA